MGRAIAAIGTGARHGHAGPVEHHDGNAAGPDGGGGRVQSVDRRGGNSSGGGYNFDASNQPGSAGALSNWNTWNNTPVYPTTTGTGTNTADNWDYASEANPVDYYGGGDDSGD